MAIILNFSAKKSIGLILLLPFSLSLRGMEDTASLENPKIEKSLKIKRIIEQVRQSRQDAIAESGQFDESQTGSPKKPIVKRLLVRDWREESEEDEGEGKNGSPKKKQKMDNSGSTAGTLASEQAGAAEGRGTKRKRIYPQPPRYDQRALVYSRDYPSLRVSLSRDNTHTLWGEAQALTPYLTEMHIGQFDTGNPDNPSPLTQRGKHTRKKTKTISSDEVRRVLFNADAGLDADWDANVQILGYTVRQRDSLVEPFRVANDGRLNIQRMMHAGLAPVGPDGQPVNLHHLLQEQPGPLAELSGSLHQRETAALHFADEGLTKKEREEFEEFRRNYWRARAYDILDCM